MVDDHPIDDDVVDAHPTDDAVVDAHPTDDAVVDDHPTDDAVVDDHPTNDAVVDDHPTDDAMVDAQPPPKRRRKEAEKCVHNQAKYPMLQPCGDTCKRKCIAKVTEIKRSAIHAQFWSMPYNQRRMWLHSHVKKVHTKRPHKETSGAHEKSFSRLYTLPGEDGIEVIVCNVFFLRTLGLRSDKVITTALTGTPDNAIVPAMDRRGSHEPKNKLSDECVQALHQHVESFHPAISHYRREHAPRRRYLPPELSIKEMHTDFNEASAKAGKSGVSYQRYRQVVADMNIGFTKLGEEECEICNINNMHTHDNTDDTEECTLCKSWRQHIESARLSREKYRQDTEDNNYGNHEAHFSVDMQKVIMLPRLPGNKTAIFTRRLVLFHETFAPLGRSSKDHPVLGILWHEAISGRNSEDLASSYTKCMKDAKYRDCKEFTFWADNCSAQNKNWTLYTALMSEVNSNAGPDKVTLKYLEKGHTFMSADSFHARIEKGMRGKKLIHDFDDFQAAVAKYGKPVPMEISDFHNYQNGVSSGAFTHKPLLSNVQEVMFERGSTKIHWKTSMGDEAYQEGDFLKKKVAMSCMKGKAVPVKESPRGVSETKKADLVQKLCPFMPENRRKFWVDLPVDAEARDLIDDFA